MLVIRPEQLRAFQAAADERLACQLCDTLRHSRARAVAAYDDASLEANVAAAIERARRHGIVTPFGVIEFFLIMLHHGPRFDEVPALRRFLNEAAIRTLRRDAPPEALAEAERLPPPAWWRGAT